ncbi:MAG: hypothetical protein SFX18_18510 [Pirellulales bacterium]|nr:hypothetical protein [Pirellulales bacterium]
MLTVSLDLRWVLLLSLCLGASGLRAAPSSGELLASAELALERREFAETISLAEKVLSAEPQSISALRLLAQGNSGLLRHKAALLAMDQVVEQRPAADNYQLRGELRFKAGLMAESLADFDKVIELQPRREPGHWQRGICYYYLGDYEKGRKQFEQYQNVDDNDVENVVWRAMCMARDPQLGWEKAAADLWKVRFDRRVPLMVVHKLFADQAQPADVLAAVTEGQPGAEELQSRQFYAHLYLGLYYDAKQEPVEARKYLELAAGKYALPGYMGDVARVHAERLARQAADKTPAK